MTRFDRYVAVDWSAAARPTTGVDSIWVAVLDGDAEGAELSNPATRAAAADLLGEVHTPDRRTLLVVDASLGYPAGTAAWFGLDGHPPWRAMWRTVSDLLVDGADNRNNRFEVADSLNRLGGGPGPFWGRPAGRALADLTATKPPSLPLDEFRCCERALRDRGFRPASGWQLLGAGSVGSQTLTVLPVLDRLVAGGGVQVWPFTTGPSPRPLRPGEMLIAETWPTMFAVDVPLGTVRDAAQVAAVAAALRSADRADDLDEWFAIDLGGAPPTGVVDEEGWVLGPTSAVGPPARDCGSGR